MKKYLKIISLTLSLLTLSTCIVGCKKYGDGDDTQSNVLAGNQEGSRFVADDLPATMDFGGKDITFFITGHAGVEGYYQEGVSSDVVQNEVYLASVRVSERLNVNLKFIENQFHWDDRGIAYTKVCNDIMTDLCEYDIIVGFSYIPMYGSTDLFCDLNTIENINLDKPWYTQGMRNVWGNNIYGIQAEGSLVNTKKLSCVFFNQQALDDQQIRENLYDTVYQGTWTLEKMEQLIENTYFSVDGTDSRNATDFYGATFSDCNAFTSFGTALGVRLFTRQNDGSYQYNAGSTKNIDIMDTIIAFVNSNKNVLSSYNNETEDFMIATAGQAGVSRVFAEGRALFMFGKLENGGVIIQQETFDADKLGVLPYPKYDEDQTDYATAGWGQTMYVPITVDNPVCVGAVFEAWNSDFYRTVSPLYFETIVQIRYSTGDAMSDMFDFIRSKRTCTFESMFEDPDLLRMGTYTIKIYISGMYGSESWIITSKKNEIGAKRELQKIMIKYGIVTQ